MYDHFVIVEASDGLDDVCGRVSRDGLFNLFQYHVVGFILGTNNASICIVPVEFCFVAILAVR